jgi:hypothetical protein
VCLLLRNSSVSFSHSFLIFSLAQVLLLTIWSSFSISVLHAEHIFEHSGLNFLSLFLDGSLSFANFCIGILSILENLFNELLGTQPGSSSLEEDLLAMCLDNITT